MDIAALIAWVVTALGGFVLLGRWIQGGGLRQQQSGASRLPAPVVFGHFLLAAVGLVLWIVYVATDSDAIAWISVCLLVVIALLGFALFARWIPVARAASPSGVEVPAEKRLPVPVVGAHGVLAVATLVLVVLSAAGIGS
jgi:hypothetical protein